MKNNALLGIDLQNDFCEPGAPLYVPGAELDVKRVANFIRNKQSDISYICLTQDTHNILDISHKYLWVDKNGNYPNDFTLITLKDVQDGMWIPKIKDIQTQYLESLENMSNGFLENNGIEFKPMKHCIWPTHCLQGTKGHAINKYIIDVVNEWCINFNTNVDFLIKGINPYTEHFGVFRAMIPNEDIETHQNNNMLQKLLTYDNIYICGQAKSHCVAMSLLQMMENPKFHEKIIILEDCMSNVPGFEDTNQYIYHLAKKLSIRFEKVEK